MDKEEADLKLRLIEVLLIIAGILVGMKQIFTDMSISIIVLFFAASIMYYTQVSDYRNKRPLSHLLVFLVALLFSATLGTAIGVTTQGDSLFRIIMVIVYYVVFTILLSIALSERSFITQKGNQLKKILRRIRC